MTQIVFFSPSPGIFVPVDPAPLLALLQSGPPWVVPNCLPTHDIPAGWSQTMLGSVMRELGLAHCQQWLFAPQAPVIPSPTLPVPPLVPCNTLRCEPPTLPPTVVPEPSTAGMMLAGVIGLVFVARRVRKER